MPHQPKKYLILIAFFILSSLPILVSAQTPVPATPENPSMREFFSLGSRNDHVIIFPSSQQAQIIAVEESLISAIRVYQPLFGNKGNTTLIPFQIVVWLTGTPSDSLREGVPALADAELKQKGEISVKTDVLTILDDRVCFIRVFNGFNGADDQRSTIAHEFAHCYQQYYNGEAQNGVDDPKKRWWVEGGAEWLASLVYSAEFPNSLSKKFRYNKDVLSNEYDNLYFWLFLEFAQGLGSTQAALDFMMGIPANPSDFPNYLETMKPTEKLVDTFHNWMLALVKGTIPYEPEINLPGKTLKTAAAVSTIPLSTPRFSGDRVEILDTKAEPGNRATITASGLTANQYAVSVDINGTWTRLQEGSPLEFCPPSGPLQVLVSRANAPEGDLTEFQLTFGQVASSTPCEKVAAAPLSGPCLVGSWQVLTYPVLQQTGVDPNIFDTSTWVFNFGADGSVKGVYGLTSDLGSRGSMVVAIPFSGTYAVSLQKGISTIFDVQTFTWDFVEGGSAIQTANGKTSDITTLIYQNSPTTSVWSPAGSLTCDGDSLSWNTADGTGTMELTRLS